MSDNDLPSEARQAEQLERVHERIIAKSDQRQEVGPLHVDSIPDAEDLLKLIHLVKRDRNEGWLPRDPETEPVAGLATWKSGRQSQVTDNDVAALPHSIGRFEIGATIGEGGFGIVARGYDSQLGRDVAIKIPRLDSLISADARDRFVTEAKAAAALSHPGIVTLYESDQYGPICYLASELIEGPTLASWLRERGKPLSQSCAAELVAALADALQHAHDRGVVHRDIKPSNIFLATNDSIIDESKLAAVAKISDFGLAKLMDTDQSNTRTGSLIGTPAYMSPEQTRSDESSATAATDIYSLGILLFELLTCRTPFARATLVATITSIQNEEPAPPSKLNSQVTRDMDAIVQKCLEKNPSRRYATAFDLQRDLNNLVQGTPVSARPVSQLERAMRWAKRNPVVATVSSLLAATMTIGLISVTLLWLSSSENLDLAQKRESQLQIKAQQLTSVIDRLFFSLATSEELQNESADGLRKTLLAEANQFYKDFLSEQPDDDKLRLQYARSLYRLGEVYFVLGDIENGVQLGNEAISQVSGLDEAEGSTDLGQWHVFVARCHSYAGRPDDAEAAFHRALEFVDLQAEHHDVLETLPQRASILAQRAEILLTDGKFAEAREKADETIGIWNLLAESNGDRNQFLTDHALEHGSALYVTGDCLRQQGKPAEAQKYYEQSLEKFQTLIKRFPGSSGVAYRVGQSRWGLGVVLAQQNKPEEARKNYQAGFDTMLPLVAKHPLVESYRWLASNVQYSLAASEMSLSNYEAVEKHTLAGIDFDLAMIDDFPQLRAKLFQSVGTHYNLLYAAYDQWDKRSDDDAKSALLNSIDFISRSVDERPKWPPAQMALARAQCNMGNIFHRKSEFETAAIWYEKALAGNDQLLEDEPNWTDARNSNANVLINLMLNHQARSNYKKSLEFCDRFVNEYPQHHLHQQVRLQRTLATAQTGRYDEAFKQLNEIVDELQEPSSIHFSSADIASKMIELDSVKDVHERVDELTAFIKTTLKLGLPDLEPDRDQYKKKIQENPRLKLFVDAIDD